MAAHAAVHTEWRLLDCNAFWHPRNHLQDGDRNYNSLNDANASLNWMADFCVRQLFAECRKVFEPPSSAVVFRNSPY